MKKLVIPLTVLVMICSMISTATAALENYGNGMIYDTDLNITWLQDANYAYTSGYDEDGVMTWNEAMTWAATLEYQGFNDWRLPITDETCSGFNCTSSEMVHLYYIELENVEGGPLNNTNPFINLYSSNYWSGTEYPPGLAWYFSFIDGHQSNDPMYYHRYAIAVRDGAPVVPEPISSVLFVTGGTLLAGRSYIKRRGKHNNCCAKREISSF